jgi:hypothetical protein
LRGALRTTKLLIIAEVVFLTAVLGFQKNKGGDVPWLSNELGKRVYLGARSFRFWAI